MDRLVRTHVLQWHQSRKRREAHAWHCKARISSLATRTNRRVFPMRHARPEGRVRARHRRRPTHPMRAIGMPGEACKLKASWMLDAPSSPEVFPLGDYLADAFIAWDFYADAPIPDAPFVLRFSEGDLVAYRALDGELAVWAGAVDTSLPPASLRRDVEDCCPAWVVAGPLSCAFGQRACRVFRAAKDEYVIELEECNICLLLEGGMVQAAVCEPRMLTAAAYSSRRKRR